MSILVGNVVQVYAKFKDKHNALIDPTTVSVKIRTPAGVDTTYTYGVNPEVLKESTGVYYININTTGQTGTWFAKWTSTGTGQGVGQTNFTVEATDI
jgi:hypothetical protein